MPENKKTANDMLSPERKARMQQTVNALNAGIGGGVSRGAKGLTGLALKKVGTRRAPANLRPIVGKGLDRAEEYIDWAAGVRKVGGRKLINLKADAQQIAEGAGVRATGGDKQLANSLRKILDRQNFLR